MNKTFKKAIAVILSVLMVVLSVPFTALAAPGDYEPNAKMYFGTFTEDLQRALLIIQPVAQQHRILDHMLLFTVCL
jgi:hypothetical protein